MPLVIIYSFKIFLLRNTNGIKVTGNRFFPIDRTIIICFFYAAFQNTSFVVDGIHTFSATDHLRAKIAIIINGVFTLFFYFLNSTLAQVLFYLWIDLFQNSQFFFQ